MLWVGASGGVLPSSSPAGTLPPPPPHTRTLYTPFFSLPLPFYDSPLASAFPLITVLFLDESILRSDVSDFYNM